MKAVGLADESGGSAACAFAPHVVGEDDDLGRHSMPLGWSAFSNSPKAFANAITIGVLSTSRSGDSISNSGKTELTDASPGPSRVPLRFP